MPLNLIFQYETLAANPLKQKNLVTRSARLEHLFARMDLDSASFPVLIRVLEALGVAKNVGYEGAANTGYTYRLSLGSGRNNYVLRRGRKAEEEFALFVSSNGSGESKLAADAFLEARAVLDQAVMQMISPDKKNLTGRRKASYLAGKRKVYLLKLSTTASRKKTKAPAVLLPAGNFIYTTEKDNESCYMIAKRFSCNAPSLVALNRHSDLSRLAIHARLNKGTVLRMPNDAVAADGLVEEEEEEEESEDEEEEEDDVEEEEDDGKSAE